MAQSTETADLSVHPPVTCAAPDCPNPAGPEGYCVDHEDLAIKQRAEIAAVLELQRQAAEMDGMRILARRVVNHERRERWRRQDERTRARKKQAERSRRRNRK